MKLVLVFAGLMMVLVFGAISTFDGLPAAGTTLASGSCNDDGDDGGGADDGDDKGEDDDGHSYGDPEDEADDCPTPAPAGECGDMTSPGVYLFTGYNYEGACLYLNTSQSQWDIIFMCTLAQCDWNDVASSLKLVGSLPAVFVCQHYDPPNQGGICPQVTGDIPDLGAIGLDNQLSTVYFGFSPIAVDDPVDGGGVEEPETTYAAADADCDGGVGLGDALANLQYLSGFEAGCVGNRNGESYQGDADCSGAIASGDVVAILTAVASGADPAC